MNKFKRGQLHSKFLLLKTQYFWCAVIIWGFYSRMKALNLELGGDKACINPFALEFHC